MKEMPAPERRHGDDDDDMSPAPDRSAMHKRIIQRFTTEREGPAAYVPAAIAKRARKRPREHRARCVLDPKWHRSSVDGADLSRHHAIRRTRDAACCGLQANKGGDHAKAETQALEQRRESTALCETVCRRLRELASRPWIHAEHH